MNFSYNWLQSFFENKLPNPKKLADVLTLYFSEVEQVKKQDKDFILDIDVRPNRAGDCFSHLGIAREISAICNLKLNCTGRTRAIKEDKEERARDYLSVEIKSQQACLRYTARVILDAKVSFSPKWLRDRLQSCGLKSVNNVVDIANYVMLETGQPLHVFDASKLESDKPSSTISSRLLSSKKTLAMERKKIIVRFAKEKENIITLDGEKYELNQENLIIADSKKPLAIAGIKGGKDAAVDLNSKFLVLESANFDSHIIRKTSKLIDLKTDASWRFEHGIDPNLTEFAINQAAFLIQKITGGKIAQGLVDFYPKKVLPKKIKLDLDYIERLLGVKIAKKDIINILRKLEFKILDSKSNILNIEVPTFRLDVSIPEDLIEEIGRLYGYEKISPVFPTAALIPPKKNLDIFWEDIIKDILKEAGFSEVYNYSFIAGAPEEKKAIPSTFISGKDIQFPFFPLSELIELENPLSLDYRYLRPSLLLNLLKDVQKNQRNFPEIKIFELGKIFKKLKKRESKVKNTSQNSRIVEKKMISGVMTGEAFYQLKGVIDLLLNKLGVSNIWYDSYHPTPQDSQLSIWHPVRCAEIKVNFEEIGFLGEISPGILDFFKIKGSITAFDIDFENLSKLASKEHEYRPIPKYPAAIRDLAVLVPREIKVEDVLNKIELAGGYLIRDIDIFDIYEGEELPEGKKNLAFHIVYQAEDRALTSEELDEIQNKIIQTLEKEIEWQVRK